jgi:hypothetical protein
MITQFGNFSVMRGPYVENDARTMVYGWQPQYGELSWYAREKPWSPCVWENGKRGKKNFLFADYIGLDFDGTRRAEDLSRAFCDYRHLIMTTKNHSDKEHRLRLVLVASRRITKYYDYEATVRKLVGEQNADKACVDAGRFFWKSVHLLSICNGGYSVDVVAGTKPKDYDQRLNPYVGTRLLSGKTRELLFAKYMPGDRYIHCWRIAKDLIRSGFSEAEATQIIHESGCAPGYTTEQYDKAVKDAVLALQKEEAYLFETQ